MATKLPSYLQPQKNQAPKKNVTYGNYDWDYEQYKKERENYKKPAPSLSSLPAKKESKKTAPIPSYLQQVSKGDKQLNLDTLTKSKAPNWQKALLSPLAAVGSLGNWVNADLQKDNGKTTGSKFLGRTLDQARSAYTGGAVIRTTNKGNAIAPMETGSRIGNLGGDLLGMGLGFSANNSFLGTSQGNALNKAIGQPVGNALTKGASKLGLNGSLSKIGIAGLKTGTEFGGLNAMSSIAQGKNTKETLKSVGEGFVSGALFGAGGKTLGEIGKNIKARPQNIQNAFASKFGELPSIDNSKVLNPKGNLKAKIEPSQIKSTLPSINNANGKLKPRSDMTSVNMSETKMPSEFKKIKEYKAPVDANGNPFPEPKIVSSNKADKTTIGQKFNKLYTATVDKNKSISDFSKLANDKTYTLATNSANQKNIADYIMTDKLVDRKGNVIGKSLKEVFKDIPQDRENSFMNYALEKHNIARARKGKPVFPNRTSDQSAEKVLEIEKLNPEWKEKSKEITKWISDFMDEWGVNAGTLDKELSKANKNTYPDYIPTNRDFSTLEQAGQGYGGANKGFVNQTTPIKRATGSSRDIIDPRENIANMVARTVKTAKNNEVGQNLVNSIRENPNALTKYAQIVSEPKGNVSNVVRVLENGKPTYVQINDLGLLKAMENLNKSDVGQIEAAAKKATGIFKSLVTQKNPVFAIRNIARDVPTAYVNGSQANPLKFGLDLLKSGKDVVSNSKEFQQYRALGGGGSNFFDSGNPAKSIKELTGNINPFKKVLKTIPNGIEKFNNITESAPRFAEFKRVLAKTNDVDKALFAANDVTTNFSRGGNFTKQADSFIPYLNAGVQGLDKLGRQIKNKPLQTLGKGVAGITVPTLAINYLNRNDENYKALDNRTKDNYFIFPDINKDGKFVKIPKSRELGVLFGSLAERTLRMAQGDKKAFKDYKTTVKTNFSPANPVDNGIYSPALINLKANKDFAGRAIVPQSMLQDGRSPKYQYDEKTSELAKKLGEVANLSPKQIDYIIRSYTGVIGQMGLPALTKTPGKTPLQNAIKPITSQFVADPLYSNSATGEFYNNLDKLKQVASDKNISGKIPSKFVTNEESLRNQFNKVSKQMSDYNKLISKSSDPKEIEFYRKLIIDLANKTNKLVK